MTTPAQGADALLDSPTVQVHLLHAGNAFHIAFLSPSMALPRLLLAPEASSHLTSDGAVHEPRLQAWSLPPRSTFAATEEEGHVQAPAPPEAAQAKSRYIPRAVVTPAALPRRRAGAGVGSAAASLPTAGGYRAPPPRAGGALSGVPHSLSVAPPTVPAVPAAWAQDKVDACKRTLAYCSNEGGRRYLLQGLARELQVDPGLVPAPPTPLVDCDAQADMLLEVAKTQGKVLRQL